MSKKDPKKEAERKRPSETEALKRQREEFGRPNDRSSTDGLLGNEDRNGVGVEGEPELESPEVIASTIYYRFPGTSPSFVQTEIIHRHPNLSLAKAAEITKLAHPPNAKPFQEEAVALECPICGTWKSVKALRSALSALRSEDPELAALIEEEFRKQGWPL